MSRGEKILDISPEEEVKIYRADISDLASLERSFPLAGNMNIIFHLAACTDYNASKEKLFRTNVKGTLNLLNLAVKRGIKKFVYISSIEAMGPITKEQIPAEESYVCQPVNAYGESKLEAEKQVTRVGSEGKVETVILRLGNVYGPKSLSFISPISSAILSKNKRWLYFNRDRYLWHPVYIEDVIDGIMKAAEIKGINNTYILTDAEYITVEGLSQLIARALDIDARTLRLNKIEKLCLSLRRQADNFYHCRGDSVKERPHWIFSIEKAIREFGYSPKVNLREGIAKTIEWAKKEGLLPK